MAVAMAFIAISGAVAKVSSAEGSVWQKTRLALTLAYLFAKEAAELVHVVPWAAKSFLIYYTSLPACSASPRSASSLAVDKNIRYGSGRRNLLDIYVPAGERCRRWPAVMFVHGGVWASGRKEMFAHVGAALARQGVLAVVIQYTLFPEALAKDQVVEVSAALSWVLDNVGRYGADPNNVTMMGHSAGAHLAAMVLWERCQLGSRQASKFIGLAGIYDVPTHRAYETMRGVESMSCMTPAMGGLDCLQAMSPVVVFSQLSTLPCRCALFASHNDSVVPAETSRSFHQTLSQLGACRLVVYDSLRHNDFLVVDGSEGEIALHSDEVLRIVHESQ